MNIYIDCSLACLKCTSYTSPCQQCTGKERTLDKGKCLCNKGFYNNEKNVDCQKCRQFCDECMGPLGDCTKCQGNREGSNWHCPDGFDDTNEAECAGKYHYYIYNIYNNNTDSWYKYQHRGGGETIRIINWEKKNIIFWVKKKIPFFFLLIFIYIIK